jgi:hypothetical protein
VFGAFRQRELRPMIRIFVNLAVIELHRADGLCGRGEPRPLLAEPGIGGEVAVFVDPAGKRRGRDGVAVTRFQFRGCSPPQVSWRACPCGPASCCRNAGSARAASRCVKHGRGRTPGMRLRRSDRSRRPAGARLGCRRHRVAIVCRYDCYVTDIGTAACHGNRKVGVSRISRNGWRKRLAGQRVAGFG